MTDARDHPNGSVGAGPVTRLIGIYHASGTIWGEVSYWLRARLGSTHCSLCDITHGTFREKADWRQCRDELPVPFATLHLDERDDRLRDLTEGRTPCVVAETHDDLVMVLSSAELASCEGSPSHLVDLLQANLEHHGLGLSSH